MFFSGVLLASIVFGAELLKFGVFGGGMLSLNFIKHFRFRHAEQPENQRYRHTRDTNPNNRMSELYGHNERGWLNYSTQFKWLNFQDFLKYVFFVFRSTSRLLFECLWSAFKYQTRSAHTPKRSDMDWLTRVVLNKQILNTRVGIFLNVDFNITQHSRSMPFIYLQKIGRKDQSQHFLWL